MYMCIWHLFICWYSPPVTDASMVYWYRFYVNSQWMYLFIWYVCIFKELNLRLPPRGPSWRGPSWRYAVYGYTCYDGSQWVYVSGDFWIDVYEFTMFIYVFVLPKCSSCRYCVWVYILYGFWIGVYVFMVCMYIFVLTKCATSSLKAELQIWRYEYTFHELHV